MCGIRLSFLIGVVLIGGREFTGRAKRVFFQGDRLGAPQPSLDHRLRPFPLRLDPAKRGFPEGRETPPPFPSIGPCSVHHKFTLLHQCERSSRRGLVDPNKLPDLRRLKVWRSFESLQDGELRYTDSTVRERLFVKGSRGSGCLTQRGAIARQGLKFHGVGHDTCICMSVSTHERMIYAYTFIVARRFDNYCICIYMHKD